VHPAAVRTIHFQCRPPGCAQTLYIRLNAGRCVLIGFGTNEKKWGHGGRQYAPVCRFPSVQYWTLLELDHAETRRKLASCSLEEGSRGTLSPGVVCRVPDLSKSGFPCPRCKATMDEVVRIAPLAHEPGLIGYECPACCYVTSVILQPTSVILQPKRR
jgi:hypothetical protein